MTTTHEPGSRAPRSTYLRRLAAAAALGVSLSASAQNFLTDLELSLVTDVSGSVNLSEYQLMMRGYENAFRSSDLISAMTSGPRGSIAVNLVFFASSASEGLPFRLITNATDANAFADDIFGLSGSKPFSGGTQIGNGIDLATDLINNNNFDGTRRVIDVAGDGTGSAPRASRDNALNNGIDTINGIVIGEDPNGTLRQFYEDEVIGGTGSFVAVAPGFEDFEPEIAAKLRREILGDTPEVVLADTGRLLNSTLRASSISVGRTVTRDVGSRLFRMRSGVRPQPTVTTRPAPSYSPKGGMAKGGMAKAPITMTEVCRWEVYGQVYYINEDQDAQYSGTTFIPGSNVTGASPGSGMNVRRLVHADTSRDTWGGTVGFEYRFDPTLSAGFAISGANTDISMASVANADIDTLALMPYVSYYRPLGNYAFYADMLYGYGMNDYSTVRFPTGAVGDFDGDFHTLEINTGMNIATGPLVHGPYAQLRWLDGEMDGYTEVGPGAQVVPETGYDSLATQLGYQLSYPMTVGAGILVPQARAAWEHEFRDDQGSIGGVPLGDLDEDLAVLGAGVGYYMNCGWNVVLDYEGRLGSDYKSHYVILKAGIEF